MARVHVCSSSGRNLIILLHYIDGVYYLLFTTNNLLYNVFLIIFIKKSSEKSCLQQQCTYCQKSKAFSTHSQEKIGFRYTTKWFGSHIGASQKQRNAVKNTWIFSPAHIGEERWFCAPKHTSWLDKVCLGLSLLSMQHHWSDGPTGLGFPHPPGARALLGAQPTGASPDPIRFWELSSDQRFLPPHHPIPASG